MILAVVVVLRLRRTKGVLTLHSGLAPEYIARLGTLARGVIRLGRASFSHIVCVNTRIREALSDLGVAAARLSVIPPYLGVPLAAPLSVADAKTVEGLAPLVVTAGGADPEYGLPLLVEAIATLRSRFPQLGCVIMGSGANSELRRLIDKLELAECVRCVGEVPRARYITFVSHADVFVRPSYADGDALSVREALALGLPVVASDTDFRPPSVILFRRGDRKDLAEKIASAVREAHRVESPSQLDESDSLERLLAIYAQLEKAAELRGEFI